MNNNQEQTQKPTKIWRGKNIHLVNEENDIKFRGPLSYRHLRIAGWFFLLIAQVGVLLGMATKSSLISVPEPVLTLFEVFGSLMTPLFLVAAFSQVLIAKDGYKRLIFTYVAGAIGLYLLYILVFLHFGVGFAYSITGDWKLAFDNVSSIAAMAAAYSNVSFNIFIDLVLCTLVTFFINYRPSKYFQGKKIYLFRSFVALPILFELGSIALKILSTQGVISLSAFVIPLLTTKAPVAFFIFIALALFVKNREKFYLKKGKTHKDYKDFLHTNVNRLHFSLFLVFAILIAVVIDMLLFISLSLIQAAPYMNGPDVETVVLTSAMAVNSWGFGNCIPMIFIIPFIILFDYKKTYTNKKIDLLIPVVGVALLALVYIEGLFEILRGFAVQFRKVIDEATSPEENSASEIYNSVKAFLSRKL